jgi:hypothetical protein
MVGPGVDKTSQLVSNGSDVIRLIACVLDLKPSFIIIKIHNALQSQKYKKMVYVGSGKEDTFLLTFVSRAKGFALSFSVSMYNPYCTFISIVSRFFCILFCYPLKTSTGINNLDSHQLHKRNFFQKLSQH